MGVCCGKPPRDRDASAAGTPDTEASVAPQRAARPRGVLPNRSLRKAAPERMGSPWTKSELFRQREEFWDTRVEGSPAVWTAIKAAAEMIEADTGSGDGIATAACILEASSITTPTGFLAQCYDERGIEYRIPNWALVEPSNLLTGAEAEAAAAAAAREAGQRQPDAPFRRPAADTNGDPGALLDLQIRIGATDISVSIGENEYVDVLKRKIMDCKGSADQSISALRLFFYGKELKGAQRLKECRGIESDVVLIGHITETGW